MYVCIFVCVAAGARMFDCTAQRVHTSKMHETALLNISVVKNSCQLPIIVGTFAPLASRLLSR